MLEECWRTVGERVNQVVEVDAAMILLQDGLGGTVENFPRMKDVLAEGAKVGQTLLHISSAELLENFARLSADFLWSNRLDEFLDGASRQSIITNDEKVEDGCSEAGAEGNDGDGSGGAAQVI